MAPESGWRSIVLEDAMVVPIRNDRYYGITWIALYQHDDSYPIEKPGAELRSALDSISEHMPAVTGSPGGNNGDFYQSARDEERRQLLDDDFLAKVLDAETPHWYPNLRGMLENNGIGDGDPMDILRSALIAAMAIPPVAESE